MPFAMIFDLLRFVNNTSGNEKTMPIVGLALPFFK
jgi:hypothetical protein